MKQKKPFFHFHSYMYIVKIVTQIHKQIQNIEEKFEMEKSKSKASLREREFFQLVNKL
jgi:hypothetical protein